MHFFGGQGALQRVVRKTSYYCCFLLLYTNNVFVGLDRGPGVHSRRSLYPVEGGCLMLFIYRSLCLYGRVLGVYVRFVCYTSASAYRPVLFSYGRFLPWFRRFFSTVRNFCVRSGRVTFTVFYGGCKFYDFAARVYGLVVVLASYY